MIQNHQQQYCWNESDKDATVYLSRCLKVRPTDSDKNPLPGAKCWIAGSPDTIYTCDKDGIVTIPLGNQCPDSVDLEWVPGNSTAGQSCFKKTFKTAIKSMEDTMCAQRLTHLGFFGQDAGEQIRAYQTWFGREPTGEIKDIREELVEWHDGGEKPGGTIQNSMIPPVGNSNKEKKICLKLHTPDGTILDSCQCVLTTDGGSAYSGKTDDDGVIYAVLPQETKWVTLSVEPKDPIHPQHHTYEWRLNFSIAAPPSTVEGASMRLQQLGYWIGGLITQWNDYSKECLINFQLDNDLTPTGVLDASTIDALDKQTIIRLSSPATHAAIPSSSSSGALA